MKTTDQTTRPVAKLTDAQIDKMTRQQLKLVLLDAGANGYGLKAEVAARVKELRDAANEIAPSVWGSHPARFPKDGGK